jgi:hypothetical protein
MEKAKIYLARLVEFYEEFKDLTDHQHPDMLTRDYWNSGTKFPLEWRKVVDIPGLFDEKNRNDTIRRIARFDTDFLKKHKFPESFVAWTSTVKDLSLSEQWQTYSKDTHVEEWKWKDFRWKTGMTSKKLYEVIKVSNSNSGF